MGWFSMEWFSANQEEKLNNQPEWTPYARGILMEIYDRGRAVNDDIHRAAYYLYGKERLDMIEKLCDEEGYACNIHYRDSFGNTVLHTMIQAIPSADNAINFSLSEAMDDIIKLATEKELEVKTKNSFGNTIFHDLVQRRDADTLITSQEDEKYQWHHVHAVSYLLDFVKKNMADTIQNMTNIDGNTLLHLAAAFGQPKTIDVLLNKDWSKKKHANKDIEDIKKHSDIKQYVNGEKFKKYLNIEKPINKTNKDGLTPLHYTIVGCTIGHADAAELLLEQKDIDMKHVMSAYQMAKNLVEREDIKDRVMAEMIKSRLEEKLNKNNFTRYSGEEFPQLDQIYCTTSYNPRGSYSTPKWISGIQCQRREVIRSEDKQNDKNFDSYTQTTSRR